MKTIVLIAKAYGPASVLEFASRELPPLQPGVARIRVSAAGVNPIDARRMTGKFRSSALPQLFGTEFAGTVIQVNPGEKGWKLGDEALGSGQGFTHATVIDVPFENLVRRPRNMDWAVAGSIAGAAQTATTVLDELGPMKSLLIHGASGGVGSIAIQLARERGITVVATASARNQDYLRTLGANAVEYGPGLIGRLEQAHPEPFDASVDMIGSEDATQASLARVKPEGTLGTIAGRNLSSARIKPMWVKRSRANLEHVVKAIAEGRMVWEVSARHSFARAADAYAGVLDGHTRGKSVLTF